MIVASTDFVVGAWGFIIVLVSLFSGVCYGPLCRPWRWWLRNFQFGVPSDYDISESKRRIIVQLCFGGFGIGCGVIALSLVLSH